MPRTSTSLTLPPVIAIIVILLAGIGLLCIILRALAAGSARGSGQTKRPAVFYLLRIRLITGFVTIGLALLGWHAFGWHNSLNIAIAVFGGFIVLQTIVSFSWQAVSPTKAEIEAATKEIVPNAYADAAKVALTTQGVVLGLIALLGLPTVDVTVKVGAASLAAGVLIASSMYLLVARVPPITQGQYLFASLLQSLMLYALGFGLVCVVTGSWSGT